MENRKKIIIDMDIGDDIDDAFALYLAMKMDFDIIGITTVFKNTYERAQITKKLLSDYGKGYESVPVYAGYGITYSDPNTVFPHLCQYSEEIEKYSPDSDDPEAAIDFIIDSCRKYGKDLTVIAIGPFTNIAKVIEKDRDALLLADKVAIMGGAFFRQYADWNVMCDPEAAKIMFSSLKNLECMGADVTHLLSIGRENSDLILAYNGDDKAVKYISDLYSYWCDTNKGGIAMLHDPLVIYYALHPEVCKMEKGHVIVFTEGFARGLTFNVDAYRKAYMNDAFKGYDTSSKVLVASGVEREYFINYFMEIFK